MRGQQTQRLQCLDKVTFIEMPALLEPPSSRAWARLVHTQHLAMNLQVLAPLVAGRPQEDIARSTFWRLRIAMAACRGRMRSDPESHAVGVGLTRVGLPLAVLALLQALTA